MSVITAPQNNSVRGPTILTSAAVKLGSLTHHRAGNEQLGCSKPPNFTPEHKFQSWLQRQGHYPLIPILTHFQDTSGSHVQVWGLGHEERWAQMLLNCGAGKDFWESLGKQGDQTSQT